MRGEFDNYNISFNFWSLLMHTRVVVGFLLIKRDVEGGRSCTGARVDLSRFTHFLEIFGQKKVPFWVKNSVSWARSALLHGIYCIFH